MKVVRAIKNIIVGLLVIIYFSFVLVMTVLMLNLNKYHVSVINDIALIPIRDKISLEEYSKGDLVLVEKRDIEDISIGEQLFVYKLKKDNTTVIDVGIVGDIYPNEGQTGAITFANGSTYDMQFIAGVPTKTYNGIGTYLNIVQSQWGFFGIVLVPSFLIFVYELYAIVIEIKYGKEE